MKKRLEQYKNEVQKKLDNNNKPYITFEATRQSSIIGTIPVNMVIIGDNVRDRYRSRKADVKGDVYIIGNGVEANFSNISGDLYIVNFLGQEVDIETKKIIANHDQKSLNQVRFDHVEGNVYVLGIKEQNKYYGSLLQGYIRSCNGKIFVQNGSINKADIRANAIHFSDYSKNTAELNTPILYFKNYSENYNRLNSVLVSINQYSTNYGEIDSAVFLVDNHSTNLGDVSTNSVHIGDIILDGKQYRPGLFSLTNNSLNKGAIQVGHFMLENSHNVGFVASVGEMSLRKQSENNGEVFSSQKFTLANSINRGNIQTVRFSANGASKNYGMISALKTHLIDTTRNYGNIGTTQFQLSGSAGNHGDIFSDVFIMLEKAQNVGNVFSHEFSLSTSCDNKGNNYAEFFTLDGKPSDNLANEYNIQLVK